MESFKPRSMEQLAEEARLIGYEGKELKKFIENQNSLDLERERREAEERRLAMEAEERRLAMEAEERRLNREFELEKLRLTSNNDINAPKGKQINKNLKCMTDDEDLVFYLDLFETTAVASDIPRHKWALELTHKLNIKLRNFMMQTKYVNSPDYDMVKSELLKQVRLTEEACRTRWHEVKPKTDDLKEFYVELQRTFDIWIKTSEIPLTVEGITDLIMRDRIYCALSDEALKDVVLRRPPTAQDALNFIDQFRDASKGKVDIVK